MHHQPLSPPISLLRLVETKSINWTRRGQPRNNFPLFSFRQLIAWSTKRNRTCAKKSTQCIDECLSKIFPKNSERTQRHNEGLSFPPPSGKNPPHQWSYHHKTLLHLLSRCKECIHSIDRTWQFNSRISSINRNFSKFLLRITYSWRRSWSDSGVLSTSYVCESYEKDSQCQPPGQSFGATFFV
jgi:hypothetical protein